MCAWMDKIIMASMDGLGRNICKLFWGKEVKASHAKCFGEQKADVGLAFFISTDFSWTSGHVTDFFSFEWKWTTYVPNMSQLLICHICFQKELGSLRFPTGDLAVVQSYSYCWAKALSSLLLFWTMAIFWESNISALPNITNRSLEQKMSQHTHPAVT